MSGASFDDTGREIEAILAELRGLQEEIDGERDQLVQEFVSDRSTDHSADYDAMSEKARAGEFGPEWQKLQGRIDLEETSMSQVFSGEDDSTEAEFVRSVAEEKASRLRDLQVEPESEEDYKINFATFGAVRAEQAEIMRMVAEIKDLPLPPLD